MNEDDERQNDEKETTQESIADEQVHFIVLDVSRPDSEDVLA